MASDLINAKIPAQFRTRVCSGGADLVAAEQYRLYQAAQTVRLKNRGAVAGEYHAGRPAIPLFLRKRR